MSDWLVIFSFIILSVAVVLVAVGSLQHQLVTDKRLDALEKKETHDD